MTGTSSLTALTRIAKQLITLSDTREESS